MIAKDLIRELENLYPHYFAEEWDNVGLIIGDNKREIKRVMVSIDATEKVIDKAIEDDVDMIITHHPMIFKGIKSINNSTVLGKKIIKLIENKINLYAMHTNLDATIGGLNDYILEILEVENSKIIDENEIDNKNGIGRIYNLVTPVSIYRYIEFLKEKLEIENVRVIAEDTGKNIRKIALINGSGMSYWKKVKSLGVDLFITGDIGYHEALDSKENGLDLIDIGHFESEKWFTKLLEKKLETLGIEVIVFNDGPVFKIY